MTAPAPTGDLTWGDARAALVPLMRADNRTNFAYILREYLVLAAVLGGGGRAYSAWDAGSLPTAAFVPLALAAMFAVAAVQHRLSGLGHEASHYALFRNRWLNELVSDFLLMFPLWAMTQQFRATHLDHHRHLNDPELDPDVKRLNWPWAHRWPMTKAGFWKRFVLGALWPPYLLGYLWGQAKNANGGGSKLTNVYNHVVARVMRLACWLAALAVVHAAGLWPVFLLFWVAPLLTFYPFLMQLREIAHHSNAPPGDEVAESRIFRVHPLLSACVFPYGQDDHTTHHLFAMLPHYHTKAAHAVLMRCPDYRDKVVVCHGFFFRRPGTDGPTVLDVLARHPEPAATA